MTKIILLCAAGMSTSALVRKMQDAAKADNYECEISAHPVADASNYADADIILAPRSVTASRMCRASCPITRSRSST